MGVAENLSAIRGRIDAACREAGRDPAEVRLLPVSKTHPASLLREAYAAGARLFGENRVPEALDKAAELSDLADLNWAVIGHLQRNKAAGLVALGATEFQALDSIRIAEALDRRLQAAGRALDIFVQVNSSGEPQKYGVPPDEVESFVLDLRPFASLRVRGLMTLAVFSDDRVAIRACFDRMTALRDHLRQLDAGPGSYEELSMGMSGDFELAIAAGSTTVRVGQAIFGARPRA